MNLTKKDKQALRDLISAGQLLSNITHNLGNRLDDIGAICKRTSGVWDSAQSKAKAAIRKLQLPPF